MQPAGNIALVTGEATSVGRAIVLRFAHESAAVVVADIKEAVGAATAAEPGSSFVHCDTSRPEQVRAAVERCAAAHLGGGQDATEMEPEESRAVLRVTLDGVFHCSKYVLQAVLPRPRLTYGGCLPPRKGNSCLNDGQLACLAFNKTRRSDKRSEAPCLTSANTR